MDSDIGDKCTPMQIKILTMYVGSVHQVFCV